MKIFNSRLNVLYPRHWHLSKNSMGQLYPGGAVCEQRCAQKLHCNLSSQL
jgi:hypothetical protein